MDTIRTYLIETKFNLNKMFSQNIPQNLSRT